VQNVEVSALKTLRRGFFYLLVAILMFVAIAESAYIVSGHIFHFSAEIVDMVIVFILLLAAAVVVFLYAIFGKIRPGMRQLSEVDNGFRICYTGTTLILAGLAILASGIAVALAVMNIVVSELLFILGYITAFIGYVLTFVVGAFKLHRKYRNPLYMAAGTLFVLDIALSLIGVLNIDFIILVGLGKILTVVGYALMYIALGNTIKKS